MGDFFYIYQSYLVFLYIYISDILSSLNNSLVLCISLKLNSVDAFSVWCMFVCDFDLCMKLKWNYSNHSTFKIQLYDSFVDIDWKMRNNCFYFRWDRTMRWLAWHLTNGNFILYSVRNRNVFRCSLVISFSFCVFYFLSVLILASTLTFQCKFYLFLLVFLLCLSLSVKDSHTSSCCECWFHFISVTFGFFFTTKLMCRMLILAEAKVSFQKVN